MDDDNEEETKRKHYVCTGDCGSTSERPAVCTTQDCIKSGEPMTECACEDGLHTDVMDLNRPHEIEI